MPIRSVSRLALCALVAAVGSIPTSAAAQDPRDALVQAPTFKQPERGSLIGGLAKFAIGAEDVSRGSFALPLPIEVPSERGALLAEVLPSYAPENGISEWGIGWSAELAIQRFRLVGDVDYATDSFTSPWGRLAQGTDGSYYVAGLKTAVRLERRADDWVATDPSGSRYEFSRQIVTPEGVYAWYLTRVETILGDAASVEYAASPGGRPFVSRVVYGGREDPSTYRLDLEYESLPVPLLDYRSGYPLSLDRRVIGLVAWTKDAGRGAYRQRWRYDITHRESAFGPGFQLDSLVRTFASGETEPPISYDYDLQEQATPAGLAFGTGDLDDVPGVQDLLTATDDPDGVQPDHAALIDVDEDGLPDLEHGFAFTLFHQSASGAFVAEQLPPPPAGADSHCRPPDSIFNSARALLRMAGPGTALEVLVLEAQSSTTEVRVCNRAGVPQFSATVPGRWSLGANTKVVDLNRDDRPDLLMVDTGQVEVLENISGEGCGPGGGTCVPFGFRAHPAVELGYLNGFPFTPSATWAQDMNGDGNPDLVQRSDDRMSIWYGRGRFRFEEMETQLAFVNRDGNELFNLNDWEITWVDANKDGLTDALISIGQESSLFINEGDRLQEAIVPVLEDAVELQLGAPVVGDLRARGDLDLVFISAGVSAIALTMPTTGLLVGADDGKGTVVGFDYERSAAAPGLRQRPSVLRSLTVASAGDDPVTYRYAYESPRLHSVGHFLVGFATVEATAPETRTLVDFHHDDDVAGQVETSRAFDGRSPGIAKFTRTAYEEAAHAGVRTRRGQTTWTGWCSGTDVAACVAGTASASVQVTENLDYERDICPTRVRRTDRHGQLETRTPLAAPSGLAGALHCLPAGQVWTGTHPADPTRDFRLESRLTLDNLGQMTRLEQLVGGEALTLQEVSYDPATHRVTSVSSPGRGSQLFAYDPDTGHLERTTGTDGVVASVPDRDPQTDALLELVGDRGPGGVRTSSFRYDGMERLATGWSDFGGSSAERPLQSIRYQFATTDFPALVQVDELVDAATGTRQESAFWTYPDGTDLASATRIPGRWVFDAVSTVDRNQLRTATHRREPLLDGADVAMQTYGSLRAQTTQLADEVSAGFGHAAGTRDLVQQGVERRVDTELSIADGLLLTTARENDTFDTQSATDARGLLISSRDQLGNVTHYDHDALGRLVAVTLPDGTRQRLTFDSSGRPATVTRDGVGTVTYAYQPVTGLLDHKEYRDTAGAVERRVDVEYDAIGRVVGRVHVNPASGDERRFTFRYDGDVGSGENLPGQRGYTTQIEGPAYTATIVRNPDGSEASSRIDLTGWMEVDVSSTYHASGALKESHRVITRLSDGAVIDDVVTVQLYDGWGRLERITANGTSLATLHYDGDGQVGWIDIAGGQRIDNRYDPATHRQSGYTQQVSGDAGTWQTGIDWNLDNRGFIADEAISLSDQSWLRTYDYDPRGFLVGAEDPAQRSTYSYTRQGQPDRIEDGRGARAVFRGNRNATTVADIPYHYDASGRVIARGDATYGYGPDGHLSLAQVGARTLVYHYDADGNRLLKVEAGVPVAAYLAGGYLTDDAFISPVKIDGRVVGVLEDGDFHLLATDPRGTLLADQDGTPRLASPFGVRDARPDLSAALDYVEKSYDPDLGTVRMGVRDYDPLLGQFWTPDPLYLETIEKCAESPVDCNLYTYARNNPVSFVDPDGMDSERKGLLKTVGVKVVEGAVHSEKKQVGPVKVGVSILAGKVKVQNFSVKGEATIGKITVEKKGHVFTDVDVAGEFALKAGGVKLELGLDGVQYEFVAVEAKLAGSVGPIKGGVTVGASFGGGYRWRAGKLALHIKSGVGLELEIDAQAIHSRLTTEPQDPVPAIVDDRSDTAPLRDISVAYLPPNPPAPSPAPAPRPAPRPQAPHYGSCADPDSPPGGGSARRL
ncbi:MAG TPA: RHS repeat-associated core domain-containing protein [Kofleriaceae bacterium]|nr:RHS repeat-associated core domain-containing protein [Kofleriaceae bacterium]